MNKFYNFLGLAKRSGNILEGYNKCDEGRNKKRIFLFLISNDASETSKRKFVNHCNLKNIPYIIDFSGRDLGVSVGREEVKILAILDKNMAEKLKTLYKEEKSMEI